MPEFIITNEYFIKLSILYYTVTRKLIKAINAMS